MHAALMLPHQLVEAAGRDLLSFTRNSRIQSCGQRRLHFAPLVLSIWTSLRAPGLQPASKCLRPLLWALCSQLLLSCPQEEVEIGQHLRITGGALRHWLVAQLQDSAAVGSLWLLGLYLLKVPWAPLWALLGAVLQIVPHIGPVLSLIGPVFAAWIHWGSLQHSLYVLMLYAGIVIVDGFLLQPYIMNRT